MIEHCSQEQESIALSYLEKRFGIKRDVFKEFSLYAGSKGRIFLGPSAEFDMTLAETVGILIARVQKGLKPSSDLFQLFGKYVTRNGIALTRSQVKSYLRGDNVQLSPREIGDASRGYVMLKYLDQPIACGLLKGNWVENVMPKANRLSLDFL